MGQAHSMHEVLNPLPEPSDHTNIKPEDVKQETPTEAITSTPMLTLPEGPKVSNIVAGANFNCRFDLRHVALCARNTHYNAKRFPACIIRMRSPAATATIFESGRVQILGTKSVADARLACRKVGRMLQKLGYQPRMEGFAVHNVVANADTRMLIRLEGLAADQPEFASYEPELFPGLVYQVMEPKVKVIVFAKGKLIFVGAKKEEHIREAARLIYPMLLTYRRT